MDKPSSHPLNVAASELSLSELTPVNSSEGDYAQSSLGDITLQQQTFFYDSKIVQGTYQRQQYDLQFQSTQNLYPIDGTQVWTGSISQQTYVPSVSSSLPKQSAGLPVSGTTSIKHDYVPLVKRPSIAGSIHSTISHGEEQSTPDEAGEKRRERRRAQNRAAQRAFRARKEETIKESSTRLDALQKELARLQSNNINLSETVSNLRGQIAILQRQNTQLKRNSTGEIDWDNFDVNAVKIRCQKSGACSYRAKDTS